MFWGTGKFWGNYTGNPQQMPAFVSSESFQEVHSVNSPGTLANKDKKSDCFDHQNLHTHTLDD